MSTTDNETREGLFDKENPPACPRCGAEGEWLDSNLRALGYDHRDDRFQCEEGHTWSLGKPRGEYDGGDDLKCGTCGQWGLVHFIALLGGAERFQLMLKCPDCFHLWPVGREAGHNGTHEGRCHVGYPQVTGDMDPAEPFPFMED